MAGELVDLITRLLQPVQSRRLDCGRAREHALFGEPPTLQPPRLPLSSPGCVRQAARPLSTLPPVAGELDFHAMARRQLTPPFVPKVSSATDTQYFDQSGREEEAEEMQKMMKDNEYLQMRDGDPMISAAFSLWGGDENI